MNIEFTKMHGLGNDFVVIDNMNGRIILTPEQVVFLCDRHKGIGADGVILVEQSEQSDCFMNYINADGSLAQMCGNGVRCTAKFLKDNSSKDKKDFNIATRSGNKHITYFEDETFSVNMGKALFESNDFPNEIINLCGLDLNFVVVGNPFVISMVDNLEENNIEVLGPLIENDKNFPNRINLELVKEVSPNEFEVQVWERGCGETLACGTGACAVYALLRKLKNISGEITIHFKGGKLYMSENEEGDIIMRGEAKSVYTGMIYVK
ncbi:MAG: diaminopimelate epimerase [Candidatus Pacebacteria bacterium]|nr:diaminopimelate epimerase [Candidatus Paceibacterota bacterium]